MNSFWDIIKSSYYNNTKYEDEPNHKDTQGKAPIMQRNNPDYKSQFIGSEYYNSPNLWGNPPPEERYWSDPNVKRVAPDYINEIKDMLKDRFGYGNKVDPLPPNNNSSYESRYQK